jgi:hypothetical protein
MMIYDSKCKTVEMRTGIRQNEFGTDKQSNSEEQLGKTGRNSFRIATEHQVCRKRNCKENKKVKLCL